MSESLETNGAYTVESSTYTKGTHKSFMSVKSISRSNILIFSNSYNRLNTVSFIAKINLTYGRLRIYTQNLLNLSIVFQKYYFPIRTRWFPICGCISFTSFIFCYHLDHVIFSEIKKWKYVGAKGEISKSKYSLLKYSFYNAYKRKYLFLFS